ncbi:preprotein translocase subunit YajC [Candidatus Cloacimonadota bacterium]
MFYSLMQAGTDVVAKPNMLAQFFPFILMFGILYLLIIRPQRKRQKETQNMLENLKLNDVVITNGGIIGKIVNVKKEKNIIVLRVDETSNTKIEFQKNAIVGLVQPEEKK